MNLIRALDKGSRILDFPLWLFFDLVNVVLHWSPRSVHTCTQDYHGVDPHRETHWKSGRGGSMNQ